ncbi:shikimate kinase [Fulvivirga sediminis]|uniref:Shikimate kinase n=1 Tax=Fulvivirga sediminis TaxID=2803949 RepID=A0A937F523_9BACT|nr:shikimate kinase [Fulvivirga sediminis]MBL3655042.1 shikimate kinase [Fulvivirga sediminis]
MALFNRKIVLIGMPGSGKTTVGRQLAQEMNLAFIDMDEEIVKREGRSIAEIFSADGEDYFREVENKVLQAILGGSEHCIVATGGGAPCFFDSMEVINKNGISVFIDETVEELVVRMGRGEVSKRPKLYSEKQNVNELLEELFQKRKPFYNQAGLRWSSEEGLQRLIEKIKKAD